MKMQNYILLVDCSDEKGLIHKITGVLYENGLISLVIANLLNRKAITFLCGQNSLEKLMNIL